jgi:hypothetical protein
MLTTPESKLRHQLLYGVKILGPHNRLVRDLPEEKCEACDGVGLLDVSDGYRVCPVCLAWGSSLRPNTPAIRAMRARIQSEHPNAVVRGADQVRPDAFVAFLANGAAVIENLADGSMIVCSATPVGSLAATLSDLSAIWRRLVGRRGKRATGAS